MPNAIIERQKIRIHFDDPDMDFVFSWILGAGVITGFSLGELFFLTQRIREGDPASWREAFRAHGDFLSSRAQNVNRADYLAATFAYRAAIEYCDPTTEAYAPLLGAMKDAFAKVVRAAIMRGPKIEVCAIACPALFLVGAAESRELQRQSHETHAALAARGVDCTLRVFTAEEGTDAHCRGMKFPLAHRTVFDWLDQRLPLRR